MELPITGGCFCGSIRYEVHAEPIVAGNCHCRDCQRATGAPHISAFAIPTASLRLEGGPSYYASQGGSGKTIRRAFCPRCGTTLFGRSDAMAEMTQVMAATLDDASWFAPQMNIYTASAQPWDVMDPKLPSFPQMPPVG